MSYIHRPSPTPKRYYYDPTEDITTHELAQLVPYLIGLFNSHGGGFSYDPEHQYVSVTYQDVLQKMPDNLRRHFSEVPPKRFG